MFELLALLSLERRAKKWRRRLLAATTLLLLAVGIAPYALLSMRSAKCRGAQLKLADVWDEARKSSIHARFLAANRPCAEDVFRSISELLDRYASDWSNMYTEACDATTVRGEQSGEMLDLRMTCLATRLEDLRATTNALSNADTEIIDHAVVLASALPRLSVCSDAVGLRTVQPQPTSPRAAQEVELLSRALAEARVLHDAEKFKPSLALLEPLMPKIHALAYAPLEAQALALHGEDDVDLGNSVVAEHELFDASVIAEQARDDRALFRARYVLAWTMRQEGRPDDAMRWLRLAENVIHRLHDEDRLWLELLSVRSLTLIDLGRRGEARQDAERALDLASKIFGPKHRETAIALISLGVIAHNDRRLDAALAYYTRAEGVLRSLLGPTHPGLTQVMLNIGTTLRDLQRTAEARVWVERALKLRHDTLGIEDRQIVIMLLVLGTIDNNEGNWSRALQDEQESIRIAKAKMGDHHPLLALPLVVMGRIYVERKNYDEALRTLEQALLLPKRQIDSKPEIKFPLGRALWESGRDRARGLRLIAEAEASCQDKDSGDADVADEIHAWRAAHPDAVSR
jgi:eukaryotic-like serine/threonine-protein kinase